MLKFLSIILISLLPINALAIEINSPAFKDGEKIPKKYGCKYNGGKNISIPIQNIQMKLKMEKLELELLGKTVIEVKNMLVLAHQKMNTNTTLKLIL